MAFKFQVRREEWLRGEGQEDSCLLRAHDGKMCCLGFFALAKGLSKANITGRATPAEACYDYNDPKTASTFESALKELLRPNPNLNSSRSYVHKEEVLELMRVNDSRSFHEVSSEQEREEKLTKLFLGLGIEVEFVD